MIRVKNLTKVYKVPKQDKKKNLKNLLWPPVEDKIGVNDISFEIEQGEIVGFVGPNGAGKTTTIKMLSGILTPTHGSLEVCGYVPYKQRKEYTKEIGVLMGQRSVLFYDIAPIESFKFYRDVYSLGKTEFAEKVNLFSKQLNIESLLNIPVRKLSLGQRMRCEIVASLLHNPKVLFLDEPTIGLDIIGKQHILDFLIDLNKQFRTTIFLTTHDLRDIDRLCQRIIILDQGVIRYDGLGRNLQSRDQYKIVEVFHQANFQINELNLSCEVIFSEPTKKCLKVAREELPNVIHALNVRGIMDLNIAEISLEEIIRDMYRNREGEVYDG